MNYKVGDIILCERGVAPRVTTTAYRVERVALNTGKVVLQQLKINKPIGKAVSVKIANIGAGPSAGTTFYVKANP